MNQSPFHILPDHYAGMAELHRRIAPSCISPSLNWHIALWPEPNFRANADINDQEQQRTAWLASINEFLCHLEQSLSGDNENHRLMIQLDGRESDTKKSKFLMITGRDFTWKIKVEVHFEYVTITILLTASRQNPDEREDGTDCPWPEFLADTPPDQISNAFSAIVSGGRDGWGESDEADAGRSLAISAAGDLLYNEVWNRISKEIQKRTKNKKVVPGFLFADFRSIFITSRIDALQAQSKVDKAKSTLTEFKETIDILNHGSSFKEYVGCSMLDHRCLYISTLGARDDDDVRIDETSNVVRFLIISLEEPEKWQMGRLLERIHSVGVARLAALKDLDRIRIIGRTVQAMGLELDDITKNARPELSEIEEFLERLNLLGTDGPEEDQIKDGASYRISRSGYYANLLSTRLEDLRISRVEGWQPYDEFLRRRLFPTFRFITDVGKRIESLRARVNSVIWLIETRQTRVQIGKISDIQKSILSTESKTNEEIVRQNLMIEAQDKLNSRVNFLTAITIIIGIIQVILAFAALP